jgi:hypothetical protein
LKVFQRGADENIGKGFTSADLSDRDFYRVLLERGCA